jgi:DNA-binding transcriptional MerR regulator
MSLARSFANGHAEDCCILCLAGWLWQAELGVVSRELRELVLEHRRCHAMQSMRTAAVGRCVDCGDSHDWTTYWPAFQYDEIDGQHPLDRCTPPPWICSFREGTIASIYRAALFLQYPHWSAREIINVARNGVWHARACPGFCSQRAQESAGRERYYYEREVHQQYQDLYGEEKGLHINEIQSYSNAEEEDDDHSSAFAEGMAAQQCAIQGQVALRDQRLKSIQTQHYDAIRSQRMQARRMLGGVRISPFTELTTAVKDMNSRALPQEHEDATDVRLAAALCWIARADCRAELAWLLGMATKEIVQYLRSVATRSFALGFRAVVGYVFDMLVGFDGCWTRRLLQARTVAHAGAEEGASLDILFDGRWSFRNKFTWSSGLKNLCRELLSKRNEFFYEHMERGLKRLDVDTRHHGNFEGYASSEGCFRFAEYRGDGLRHLHHKGDVLFFMEKYPEAAYVVVGANISACKPCTGGFLLMLDVDLSSDINIRLYPKPTRVQGRGRTGVMQDWGTLPQLKVLGFCEEDGPAGTRRVEKHVRILDPHGLRALGESPVTRVAGWTLEVSETAVNYPERLCAGLEPLWTRAGAGGTLRVHPLQTTMAAFDLPLCFLHALFVFRPSDSPDWLFEAVGDTEVALGCIEDVCVDECRVYDQVLQLHRPKPGEMYTKELENTCSLASRGALEGAREICITRENKEIILTMGSQFSAVAPRDGEGALTLFFGEPAAQRMTFTSELCEVVYAREHVWGCFERQK